MQTQDSNTCPICTSTQVAKVIEIRQVPIYCNVLWSTHKEAVQAPKGDILLWFCQECGHLFNAAFDPRLIEYTRDYENSLHFSPRFQQYAKTLASELVKRHSLQDKRIVEIACGKGDFLRLLCSLGNNRGVGFDPSYELALHEPEEVKDITILKEYFGERPLPWTADLICCRQALEHIHQPTNFLKGINQSIGESSATAVFFEVPNSLYTLRDLGIWDLIYEHCSYFWNGSLRQCFELAGFGAMQTGEVFEGQFLSIETLSFQKDHHLQSESLMTLGDVQVLVDKFEDNYFEKVKLWEKRLNGFHLDRKRAVIWGGGSKGVTFLNVLGAAEEVPYVVDINPKKQGKFIPGTGQEVITPQAAADYDPDVVIVMNQIYQKEIFETIKCLGMTSKIIAA